MVTNIMFFRFFLTALFCGFTTKAVAYPITWMTLGPEGQAIARAIVTTPHCPEFRIDNQPATMTVRAPPHRNIEVTVCEAVLPKNAQEVTIAGQVLPKVKKEPTRIVVFGDTGCVLSPTDMQGCLSTHEWPFKKIADEAAALKPDLVIHLGDYWYREMPCLFNKRCQNSPYGNHWDSWNADFFTPAENLLKTAPWVFVRGNHENCYRNGTAWFRFLDPNPYTDRCQTHTPLYKISLGEETLFVMDSSEASDAFAPAVLVKAFQEDFKKIQDSKINNVWLLTHKPLWEMDVHYGNKTLKAATKEAWPLNIKWIFSGHVHNFEILNILGEPTQFIVGTGGGALQSQKLKTIDHTLKGIEDRQFGFLLLTKQKGVWVGDFYDQNGIIRQHFNVIASP